MRDVTKTIQNWRQEKLPKDLDVTIYLFGSLVQDSGMQFDVNASDIDLITIIPDNLFAYQRVSLFNKILHYMHLLEVDLMIDLKRNDAGKAIVSNVVLTKTEAEYSIHKSGDRRLLSFPRFFDLSNNKALFELTSLSKGHDEPNFIGSNTDQLSIIRFCQENRNKFVTVSANKTRIFASYHGFDPIPKASMRNAAILAWNNGSSSDNKREDLLAGMNFLQQRIDSLPKHISEHSSLQTSVAYRRANRGLKKELSENDLLLINELLFDEAISQLKPSLRKNIDDFISGLDDKLQTLTGQK